MQNRPECPSVAIRCNRVRCGLRPQFGALVVAFLAVLALSCDVFAQGVVMPPETAATMTPGGIDTSAPPMAQQGNVSFFSQELGTILRLRYNTESYGQDGQGNFDIGTMQVVTMDDTAALFDGQVTMNDVNGVGYNVGVGYRWMNFPPYAMNSGRVDGVALWADGTHTEAGNFFPQIGVSYESLGEMWDMRSNLYVPVGKQDQVGAFKQTGEIGFQGNSIAQLTQAIVDSSYTVGEIEFARRLGSERDAWAFAGPYFVANNDQDSAGGRAGVRGYATPDLLLQVAVTHDDVFETNATFQVQWFVGRTRTNFQPTGGVADRLREPFMRNDYVALSKSTRTGGIPLTNPDGTALRIVHFDSDAAAGGNGTIENPYNELDLSNGAGSQNGDILFAHSTSTFDTNIILKDDQRLLGEGNNKTFTVVTEQEGTITIPESSPGARALARPIIATAAGDAITLADNNEVSNFDINGQSTLARAIAAPVGGAGNPNLNNLAISNTAGNAIEFTPATITDPSNAAAKIVRGNVTIDTVTFNNVGGNGIDIDAANADIGQANVTSQETIAISNVTSTGGAGRGINIENTHTGRTATLTNYTYDGGTTSFGALRLNNIDGTFTASASTLTNGSTAAGSAGVEILGDTDGTLTFQSTFVMNNVDNATTFAIDGADGATDALGGTVTVAGAITNDTGRSVSVENVGTGANIDFNGAITDTGEGVLVSSNSGGQITFLGDLAMTIDTAGATAVNVDANTGASIDFAGDVVINSTNTANGFIATDGGTLAAPGTTNSVSTETGQAVKITGMTIAAGGVAFRDVNRTGSGALNAIQLETNTGGPITVGNATDSAGDAGTIAVGTANAVRIANSANVSINGLTINNGAGLVGVEVVKSTAAAMTTNLSDLAIDGGATGISTTGTGGSASALTMTINDTTINNATTQGMLFDDVDNTPAGIPIAVNNAVIDGGNLGANVDGIHIQNSNGSITFDNATIVRNVTGDNIEVTGGASGTITYNGQIINSTTANAGDTAGRSVNIHGQTGGNVTFGANSSINDDNAGMLVDSNTGGTFTFLGNNDFNTAGADAVTITNNAGATISLSTLDIDTTSGRGLVATGGGTLSVLGGTNTIDTTTGTGLDIEGMTIDATGVSFQRVSVNGATNGIVLQNLTGSGQVTVGTAGGAANSGGSLSNTTSHAIVLVNVANADFNNVQIVNAGGVGVDIDHSNAATGTMDITFNNLNLVSSTGLGIDVDGDSSQTFNLRLNKTDATSIIAESVDMDSTGTGPFKVLLDNIDIATTGADVAFSLTFGDTSDGDLTIRNGSSLSAANGRAFEMFVNGAGTTVATLIESSSFTSVTAEDMFIENTVGAETEATIRNNTFANSGSANDVLIRSVGSAAAGTRIDLNLTGNGTAGSTIRLFTDDDAVAPFNFGVVDLPSVNANNPANVITDPAAANFEDIDASDVTLPNGP